MKCIAYVRRKRDGNRWVACSRRATADSVFCRTHSDAACGVILGLWVRGFPERLRKEQTTRPRADESDVRPETSIGIVH